MSAVAGNAYFERDFRRQFPTTEFVTQSELAELLLTQGGIEACVHPLALILSLHPPLS